MSAISFSCCLANTAPNSCLALHHHDDLERMETSDSLPPPPPASSSCVEDGNNNTTKVVLPSTCDCDEIAQFNNAGVSLLEQGRRTEAANNFLRALWQLEHQQQQQDQTTSCCNAIISSSHLLSSTITPVASTTTTTTAPDTAASSSIPRERALPSCYIFQREDYDEGLHVYQDALPILSSQVHQQVVTLRYNMGLIYVGYKQYNQARRWFQMAWNLLQQYQPADEQQHLLQLYILHNLGYCSYCLGLNPEAMQFYQDALAVLTTSTGSATMMDRAAAYNCIAVLLFHRSSAQENDSEEALTLLQESLNIYQANTIVSSCRRQVATVLGNMGRIHFLTSDHEMAMNAFHKAYHIRKQLLGDDSMDTAAMLFNLGQSLHYRGALEPALEAYREFLRVASGHYGSATHRDICAVQRAMAQVHRQQGQLDEACTLLRRAFQAGCGAVGPLETEVSCILSEMGSLYAERNDYTNAIDCFLHFLQTQETLFKDTQPLHANILITKINIARVYKHNTDYVSALRYYKEVHAMQVQILANNKSTSNSNTHGTPTPPVSSLEVASTLSSMGLMLYLLQAYKPALDCYQEALRVRLEKLGTSQHADVAETINSIGLVLFKLGMMDMAKEAFQECIQLRTKLLLLQQQQQNETKLLSSSSSSKEIAVLMFNLATSCMQNGEEEQGIEWYCESLRVERQVLGNHHPDVSMTLQHIARVHEERGDFESAIDYFRQALEIAKSNHNNQGETVVRLLRVIGNLHFMLGEVPKTMVCFAEASRLQPPETNSKGHEGVSRTGANFYGLSRLHPPGARAA
ncbi:Kinesin light chain [Seminavis robusta]|uniref:Kinesin light chain n=1 Tax=Seminavis robusta TaxID=568900 RepID=A0A9N8DB98_9STRA|nr:Kinesin light chain [Seminavis robusta]|eukprot:Sro67_g037490.1 Kinesin light chain (803) ;mRNA; f:37494-39902